VGQCCESVGAVDCDAVALCAVGVLAWVEGGADLMNN